MAPRRPWRLDFLPHPTTPLQSQPDFPSSPRLPITPIRPRSTSPPLSSTTRAMSSSNPSQLTPPPRLHLRSLIPSPPLSPNFLSNAPQTPYPWIWRCHLCNRQYELGVTRRCLEDGHYFCSLPSPPPSPVIDFEVPPENIEHFDSADLGMGGFEGISGMTADGQAIGKLRMMKEKGKQTKSKKRRRQVKGCRAEFDYGGWSRYNYWRREVRMPQLTRRGDDSEGRTRGRRKFSKSPAEQREKWPKNVKKDCWRDCDFPSACHNERMAEREWIARKEEKRTQHAEKQRLRAQQVDAQPHNTEPGLGEQWNLDWESRMNGTSLPIPTTASTHIATPFEHEAQLLLPFYTPNIPDLNPSTDISVNIPMQQVMGPLGIDCDGLGEEGYQREYTKLRRKSLDSDAQGMGQSSSPLKEEFNLNENEGLEGQGERERMEDVVLDGGGDSGSEVEAGVGKRKCRNCGHVTLGGGRSEVCCLCEQALLGQVERGVLEEDLQMQEALSGRSLFLRSLEIGDDEEGFGDEDGGRFL